MFSDTMFVLYRSGDLVINLSCDHVFATNFVWIQTSTIQ